MVIPGPGSSAGSQKVKKSGKSGVKVKNSCKNVTKVTKRPRKTPRKPRSRARVRFLPVNRVTFVTFGPLLSLLRELRPSPAVPGCLDGQESDDSGRFWYISLTSGLSGQPPVHPGFPVSHAAAVLSPAGTLVVVALPRRPPSRKTRLPSTRKTRLLRTQASQHPQDGPGDHARS